MPVACRGSPKEVSEVEPIAICSAAEFMQTVDGTVSAKGVADLALETCVRVDAANVGGGRMPRTRSANAPLAVAMHCSLLR